MFGYANFVYLYIALLVNHDKNVIGFSNIYVWLRVRTHLKKNICWILNFYDYANKIHAMFSIPIQKALHWCSSVNKLLPLPQNKNFRNALRKSITRWALNDWKTAQPDTWESSDPAALKG